MKKKTEKVLVRDLTTGSVPKTLLVFTAPLFLSGLLQVVYNMIDMIVVGHFVGSSGLVAASNGGEIMNLLTFLSFGVANAGQVIISRYIGAGQRERIGKLVGTLAMFLLYCGTGLSILCLTQRRQILLWVNTPTEAMEYALSYTTVCMAGLIFVYGYNMVSAVLRGMGDSRHPFLFIAAASILNVILDLLFVAALGMNTMGAALATIISQAFSFLWALVFFYRNRENLGFELTKKDFRIEKRSLVELLKLGIPMAMQSAAVTFSKLYIASWINSYGVIAAAVTNIGNKLSTIVNVFSGAFSTAGGSMIAQNLGAGKYERIPKIIGVSVLFNTVTAVIMTVLTATNPRWTFGIFTTDEQVLKMAGTYIPIMLLMYVSSVLRPPMSALINGSGRSGLNFTIALLDGIVMRIGFAYVLGVIWNLGIYGFWIGDALSNFTPFFVGGVFYLSGSWRKEKVRERKEKLL